VNDVVPGPTRKRLVEAGYVVDGCSGGARRLSYWR
jgi:hypothetical protein